MTLGSQTPSTTARAQTGSCSQAAFPVTCPAEHAARPHRDGQNPLDLGAFFDTPVRQLSLGQRMRGDLAAALVHDPELLVLDEPTIGLDVVSKATVRGFLARLNTEQGTTILLTTHDLGDIEHLWISRRRPHTARAPKDRMHMASFNSYGKAKTARKMRCIRGSRIRDRQSMLRRDTLHDVCLPIVGDAHDSISSLIRELSVSVQGEPNGFIC
jgi:hypothetical protein